MFRSLLLAVVLAVGLSACSTGVYKSPDVPGGGDKKSGSGLFGGGITTDSDGFESGLIKSFPDLPLPSSHRIDLNQSVIFSSPSQSVAKIVMTGKGDVDNLYRFFETNMKAKGWTLVNSFQSSIASMYYAKPGKFVAIILDGTGRDSRVFINIGPE